MYVTKKYICNYISSLVTIIQGLLSFGLDGVMWYMSENIYFINFIFSIVYKKLSILECGIEHNNCKIKLAFTLSEIFCQ